MKLFRRINFCAISVIIGAGVILALPFIGLLRLTGHQVCFEWSVEKVS